MALLTFLTLLSHFVLFQLTPVVEPDLEGFYFNQLPFSEDVRSFSFATLNDKRFEVSEQQQQGTAIDSPFTCSETRI
jgi:hypothetical protein